MRSIVFFWIALGLSASGLSPAQAMDRPATDGAAADELHAAISRAADRPPDAEEIVAATRGRLAASIQQLQRFLSGTTETNRLQWEAWLKLPSLNAELARPQPDLAVLRAIEERYYRNQPGLELPPLLAVRKGLHEFVTALEYAAGDAPADRYRQRLAELKERLARLETHPTEVDAHQAGSIAAWLAPLGEDGAELASAVRARYCRTNGMVQVSRQFINLLLAQDVEEQNFITDFILGSYTQGHAFTRGHVSFGTIPNRARGTLEVRLEGLTACPANVAQRGRISVYSSANTTIRASKQVHISDLGLSLAPAVAACASSVQITDVEARSRIIERLSWRRANQLVPQAEKAAAQRAGTEASGKLDQQADAALGGVHEVFCQQIRAPLIRLGALPARWQFWTDDDHLRFLLVQHNGAQLSAASPAPSLPAAYDLAGSAHESLVNNFCESLLGGATIKDQAWLELMNLLTGNSPRPLWVHDRAERWSVTFSRQHPILARFDGDRIGLNLRLARVTRGDRHFDQSVEIEARFVPQITPDGPAFLRDGELAIRFSEGVDAESEAEVRALLAGKFAAVFPPELHLHGMVPPTGGSLGKLRQLQLVNFQSAGGWLTLGYQLADVAAANQLARDSQ